jgi:hypothetical protein
MPGPEVVNANQLKAIAQHYELPWPPPTKVKELEAARKEAMLRHHPDRGGSADAAAHINQWFDAVRAVREGRAVVGRPRIGITPQTPGFQFEIPFSRILETILNGKASPPTVKAEIKPSDDGQDFVFRVFFDFTKEP